VIRLIKRLLLLPLLFVVGTGVMTGAFLTRAPVPLVEALQASALRLATIDLPSVESPRELGEALHEVAERVDLKAVVEAVWGEEALDVKATVSAEGGTAEITVVTEGTRRTEVQGFEIELPTRITTTLTATVDP